MRSRPPKGRGYLQYVRYDESLGELIGVLRPLLHERPSRFEMMSRESERFLTFFPLKAAFSKRIVEWVGNEPAPDAFRYPPAMRSPGKIDQQRGVVESWWISKGESQTLVASLTDEQRKLSIEAIINDTLLIDRLVSGWSPSDYS